MEDTEVTELVKLLVNDGVFGVGDMVSLKPETNAIKGVQFASVLLIMNLTIKRTDGCLNIIPIVIKLGQDFDPENSETFFYNEVLMYREILPYFNIRRELAYPKVYYCYSSGGLDPKKDVIIMENLKLQCFELSKERIYLDFDHVSVALKSIAHFHSWSYAHKNKNNKKFSELTNKLRIRKCDEDQLGRIMRDSTKIGIQPLLDKGIETDVLRKFLKRIENVIEIEDFLMKPDDVFGVIAHGDFNNNNIFYKYDEMGKPVDTALFDFQLAKYTTPVRDLAFLLYMNTTPESRREYWSDFLKIYWDAVESCVPQEITLPSYEEFLEHFSCRAVLAYFVTSFFLPMTFTKDILPPEKFTLLTREQQVEYHRQMDVNFISQTSEIILHMLEHKYVHHFLDFCDKNFIKN